MQLLLKMGFNHIHAVSIKITVWVIMFSL